MTTRPQGWISPTHEGRGSYRSPLTRAEQIAPAPTYERTIALSSSEPAPFERPRCSELDCNRFAPAIFKSVPGDPETYDYLECAICDEPLCRKHALEELDGSTICPTCYQERALRA